MADLKGGSYRERERSTTFDVIDAEPIYGTDALAGDDSTSSPSTSS